MPRKRPKMMRIQKSALLYLPIVLISLSLACTLPGIGGPKATEPANTATPTITPSPTPTPEPLPPDLVESYPPQGGEMPLSGPITLVFNQAMDRGSVESALYSQFEQEITFTWTNDRTVVLYFSAPLEPESDLSFNIESQARSAQGMGMLQPVSLNYRTSGYLYLTQMLPEKESQDIDPSSAIIAAFNRPIVPLGGDPASMPDAFTLSPASQGRGEWINTSTYAFYPEPPLAGDQLYSVNLNPDLKSVDGGPYQGEPSWSFSTALPKLLSMSPSSEVPWPLDTEIELTFNQPMDPDSVEAHFSLQGAGGSRVAGAVEWNEDTTVFTFKPTQNLSRATDYTVTLDGNAQALGGTPLGETWQVSVTSMPQLQVYGTQPVSGGELQSYDSLIVYLSTPVDEKAASQHIRFTPEAPNTTVWWNPESLSLYVRADFKPSSDYVMTISPDLTDLWGGKLGEEYSLAFRTALLQPNLAIQTLSEAIFLTPQDTGISAQVANLSSLPMTIGNVSTNEFMALLGPNGYEISQNYQSANQVSWQQPLEIIPDITQPVEIPLQPDGSPLPPGLYQMQINLQDRDIYGSSRMLVVSNIHMIFKVGTTDALVWAIDLRSGAPLPNAPVSLYDENGNLIDSGQTNQDGLFYKTFAPITNPYGSTYAVIGEPGQDSFSLAVSSWSQGIQPWDFDIPYSAEPPLTKVYYYTDRPIYRPGQTVYYRAVVRQAYNGRYDLPEISQLPVTISSEQGLLTELELPLSAYGSAHGSYTLPDNATPGFYQISSPDQSYSSISFQVANYRKPEINLEVNFSQDHILAGERLQATINARYFFGAPAGNVPVHWTLNVLDSHFYLPDYQVGPQDTGWLEAFRLPDFGGIIGVLADEGDAETNPDGTLSLDLPTEASNETRTYILEVTLQDESGLPVSARAESEVHPAEYYIGVRADSWVSKAEQQANFEVLVTDWERQPAGDRTLRAEFKKVTWERIDPAGEMASYEGPKFIPQYTLIGSSDFSTSAEGLARLSFVPPEAGTFQLDVYDPAAPGGEGARTEVLLWVSGATGAEWPNLPNSRLRLTSNQEVYVPGDSAQIFIPNPFGSDAQALLTVERGITSEYQVLNVSPEGYNLSLPLSSENAPNNYVSVTLIGRNESGDPDFRQGYLTLEVEPLEQKLSVQLTSQPERTGPGEEVSFEVQVTDSAGHPVQGEFSLAVVDQAALALADPNAPGIVEAYYSQQPLGVRTGISLAAYGNRFIYAPPGLGGGGGEALTVVAREEFPDTAYWNAQIVTNEEGKAIVRVMLPDSLTTWQVDARGLTADTRVGESRSEVLTTKELLVRPVVPRFLVAGDRVQLAAVAQNNTPSELQVEVQLQAKGVALEDAATRQVSLPAGGRARIEWWGVAQDVDSADLVFSVYGQDIGGNSYNDAARPALGALPVLHYTASRAFRTSGTLDEGGDVVELVSLPGSFDPQGGEFSIELAPSLGAAMVNALEALEGSPYESTEATVSRFLPNLEAFRVLSQHGIESDQLEASLDRTLNDGLRRLQSGQNSDGGWGWWTGGDSDPYLTAYALFGLVRAQEAGITINLVMLQNAVGYLGTNLEFPTETLETWELDRLAFEHFVLTQYGAANLPASQALAQFEYRLSPWARALLALTLEDLTPGSPAAQTILSDLATEAQRSATGAHWEFSQDPEGRLSALWNMHTTLSNSAVVVYALAQRDPNSPLLAEALRYLMAHRDAYGWWGTTYTTAWNLMALTEVVRGTGELGGDFSFSASLNKNPIAEGQAGGSAQLNPVTAQVPVQRLYPDYPNSLLIQRSPGQGRLYYTAGLLVDQPVQQVAPLSQGLNIERAYYPTGEACPQGDCPPISSAQAGERITVRLTVSLPQDVYYLAVEDYIPAGSEILDTRLKTTQLGEYDEPQVEVLFDPRNPFAKGWGWWLFNEEQIYDDHITWTADYLPAGTYELTYTLVTTHPGDFQTRPARAWQLYFPEVQANSAGELFEIRP